MIVSILDNIGTKSSLLLPFFACKLIICHLQSTGYKYTCDPLTGGVCRNSDQSCQDHEVKFHCKCGTVSSQHLDTPTCRTYCWTPWLNRDGPGGSGDYETIIGFHSEQPTVVCPRPVGIQCRDRLTGKSYETTEQKYHCEIDSTPEKIYGGGWCVNSEQKQGRCRDYQVRFLCPCN